MIPVLTIGGGIVILGIGMICCIKLYQDKIKSIIISHDQIEIDFKLKRLEQQRLEQQRLEQPFLELNHN